VSGVAVIRYLLTHAGSVVAVVPAERIVAGDLPLNTALPALSVKLVDGVPENFIRLNEASRRHFDRVQVSYLARDYSSLATLGALVLAACPSQRGTVGGVSVDSITPDLEGPDFHESEVGFFSRSRDFIVRWVGA
jgi:hypothetical protein